MKQFLVLLVVMVVFVMTTLGCGAKVVKETVIVKETVVVVRREIVEKVVTKFVEKVVTKFVEKVVTATKELPSPEPKEETPEVTPTSTISKRSTLPAPSVTLDPGVGFIIELSGLPLDRLGYLTFEVRDQSGRQMNFHQGQWVWDEELKAFIATCWTDEGQPWSVKAVGTPDGLNPWSTHALLGGENPIRIRGGVVKFMFAEKSQGKPSDDCGGRPCP